MANNWFSQPGHVRLSNWVQLPGLEQPSPLKPVAAHCRLFNFTGGTVWLPSGLRLALGSASALSAAAAGGHPEHESLNLKP